MQLSQFSALVISLSVLCQTPVLAQSKNQSGAQTKAQENTRQQTQHTTKSQQFSFGGFRLNMTADDLQKSFPHSVIEKGNNMYYVRIANEDIKDDATAGMIYLHKGKNYAVHLLFEFPRDPQKPDSYYSNPFNQNPPCAPRLATLTRQYGKPFGPFDGSEEGLIYDEYVWDNANEKLILTCARFAEKKSKKTWLAHIRIAHNRPGPCMHLACLEAPQ